MANPLQAQALHPLVNEAFQQYQEEVAQLKGDIERLSEHYQKLMRECDTKDAEIERLKPVLDASRNLLASQYVAEHGEVVPGQPSRVVSFPRSRIVALRLAVQSCTPGPLDSDKPR